MGYESRIYIVAKTEQRDHESGKRWAQMIARFDMSCCSCLSNEMCKKNITDCYIYADDGDTIILEDEYGDPLREASISDVIAILENEIANGENYRRFFPLLAALKALEEHKEQWCELAVLHFGY